MRMSPFPSRRASGGAAQSAGSDDALAEGMSACLLLAMFALLAMLLGVTGCSDNEAAAHDGNEAAPPTLPYFEDGVVRLPPAFAQRIGLKTQDAAITAISPVVYVTGVMEFDEQRIAAVGSRISGRVKEVRVIEGTKVKPGDTLATMESAELGKAQADIFAVKARAQYADTDEERKKKLLSEGIASIRSAELAAQESKITDAELRAAKQRVQALGGSASGKSLGVMALTSPIEGDVVKVHVFRGQAVEPSYTAFTIADRRSLWVRLSVFEGEVGNIRVGDPVEISAQVTPNEFLTGTVTFISTVLDAANRSAEVRVVVPNEDGKLRVGQAVNARIKPSAASKSALAVPRLAIVQVDGKPTVFVAVDDTGVVPKPIELGVQGADLVEVTSGLNPGDRVVIEGVFALKSELFR
ncbi:MAG TPA: efflux RND transporter periplasmic adaptor subunit [Nannocystis sp.]